MSNKLICDTHKKALVFGAMCSVCLRGESNLKEGRMTMRTNEIWAEMARRKKQFHASEDWRTLRLWGLFNWNDVKRQLDRGELLTDMRKENRTVWVWPSEQAYRARIEPLLAKPLDELLSLAGWTR